MSLKKGIYLSIITFRMILFMLHLNLLKVRYRQNAPFVLHGISCIIEGRQKIGIVGRTGSGKTTLIGVLFRLVEPTEGRILVDEIDICTIGLHDLRSRLGIIPQDPTLFNGSVRFNLDPLSQHTDQEIWEVKFHTNVCSFLQIRMSYSVIQLLSLY